MEHIRYNPPVVFSVHGIRTKALWQKNLSNILVEKQIVHVPYNFGYYNLHRFLFKYLNDQMVDKFYDFYSTTIANINYENVADKNLKRPSIIAHSFGSYIVGYCMLKYPDVIFDKVILCGSILPNDFDWKMLFRRDQINHLKNEYGVKDFWTKNVSHFVSGTGDSGNNGFKLTSKQFKQERFDYFTHGDYFKGQHINVYWIPFLQKHSSNFYVVHGHDIEDIKDFISILDISGDVIDEICYGDLPHYHDVQIPAGLSDEWIKINPDIYTFLFDKTTDKVIGYVNAMPLSDEAFEKVKNGKLQDNEITAADVEPFFKDQNLKIYLMSIAILPDARKINQGLLHIAFEKLLNGFIGKLIEYYNTSNIRVIEFAAVGWTNEGRKLCKLMGMKEFCKDEFDNPIYTLNLEDESPATFDAIKDLIEIYKKRK